MPKDEFDFEDPFELNGMALLTHEDTTDAMCECFIEEFMRLGYNHRQVLALFRNPQYFGPHLALEKRGEPFIRDLIAEVFARWGKAVTWPVAAGILPAVEPGFQPGETDVRCAEAVKNPDAPTCSSAHPGGKRPPCSEDRTPTATDPTGAPVPEYTL